MKSNYIFSIFILCFFISCACATISNNTKVIVNISASTDSVNIFLNNDTTKTYPLPISFAVPRSRNNLLITATKDTTTKHIEINSQLSNEFIGGNLFTLGVVGYAIDLTNKKRYTYPPVIYINFCDETNYIDDGKVFTTFAKGQPIQKNDLFFKFSIPEGNHFYINRGYEYGTDFGFIGLTLGFDYYFTDKYCINMDVGGLLNFPFPFPVSIHPDGNWTGSDALFCDLQLGSHYKRLQYYAGLQLNKTYFSEQKSFEIINDTILEGPLYKDSIISEKNQLNCGLALSAQYRATRNFYLSFNYYPSFIILEKPLKSHYSHLLFFSLTGSLNNK